MGADTYSAIIMDDEKEAIDSLLELLKSHKQVRILETFTDLDDTINYINSEKPELLFLDIQMSEKTGFEVVREIRTESYHPHIIFVTAYNRYAIQAIKHAAFDYLLKPVDPDELADALIRLSKEKPNQDKSSKIEKLLKQLARSRKLKFNTCSGFIVLDTEEIIYCEASRNYCDIYLTHDRPEVVTMNLNNVGKLLPEDSFFRISRFHIINLKFLTKVERRNQTAYLKAGTETIELKISSRNSKLLEKMFNE